MRCIFSSILIEVSLVLKLSRKKYATLITQIL